MYNDVFGNLALYNTNQGGWITYYSQSNVNTLLSAKANLNDNTTFKSIWCTEGAGTNGTIAGLTLSYGRSYFRIRNDGSTTYFMNGDASAWSNYTSMSTAGNWIFPHDVNLEDNLYVGNKFTANGYVSIIGDFFSINTYDYTVSNSANVYISTTHRFCRSSSSSKRYKHDITPELNNELNPDSLYELDIVQYKYNDDYLSEDDIRYKKDVIGFIAEDVYEKYPIASNYTIDEENGDVLVEDWDSRYMVPAMLKLIQEQKKEIDLLKEEVAEIKLSVN